MVYITVPEHFFRPPQNAGGSVNLGAIEVQKLSLQLSQCITITETSVLQ